MRRPLITFALSAALLVTTAAPAFAHASFDIKALPAGSTEAFVLRVPVEREVDNERVEVLVPGGWTITACDGAAGWACANEPTEDGLDTLLTLTREPDGDGSVERFSVTMTAPADEGVYTFPALQHYTDGEEAAWIGEAGSDHPAPRIQVGDATTPVERAAEPEDHATADTATGDATPPGLPTPAATETSPTEAPTTNAAVDDEPTDGADDGAGAARFLPVIIAVVVVIAGLASRRRRTTG